MKEKIKSLVAEIKGFSDTNGISDDADLMNDVGLDSLQMINFLLQLEDKFDIELDFDSLDYDHMRSLPKLTLFIENLNHRNK